MLNDLTWCIYSAFLSHLILFFFYNFIGKERKLVYTNKISNKSFGEHDRIIIKKGGLLSVSQLICFNFNRKFRRGLVSACDFV